jgi:hypothetical protein
MELAGPAHVLVVANRTAATEALLDAVRARVERDGAVYFHLLVPHSAQAHDVVDRAVPLLEAAAHRPVTGSVARRVDPMDAIEEALHDGDFDEIILSTLPPHASRWLRMDLPSRVGHLGLPLTLVVADDLKRPRAGAAGAASRSRRGA